MIRDAIERGVPVLRLPPRRGVATSTTFGPDAGAISSRGDHRVPPDEPARGRSCQRAHVPPRRPGRQGDGRHERLRARDGARARAHGRARGRVHALAESRAFRRVVEMGRARASSICPPGPEAPMPREARARSTCPSSSAGVEAFRSARGLEYDLIHAHYWLSGVAGLRCASGGARRSCRCSTRSAGSRTAWRDARPRSSPSCGSPRRRASCATPTASSPPTWWSARTWSGTTARAPSGSR